MIDFKLSFRLSAKNKWQTTMIILMLTLSMFFFGCLVSGFSNIKIKYRYAKDFLEHKGIYCMSNVYDMQDTISEFEYVSSVEKISTAFLKNENIGYLARGCTALCAKELKVPLEKGVWYTDAASTEGYQNAVVTANGNNSVGDKLTLYDLDNKPYNFIITGVLPQKTLVPGASYMATPYTVDDMLGEYTGKTKDGRLESPLLFFNQENAEWPFNIMHAYVIFQNDIPEPLFQEYVNRLFSFGRNAFSFETIKNNTLLENKQSTEAFLPLTLIFGVVCVMSLIVIALICVDKNRNLFVSYYIVGARKRNIYTILFYHFLWIFIIASILYGAASLIPFNPFYLDGLFYKDTVAQAFVPIGYFAFTLLTAFLFGKREIDNIPRYCILEN